MQIDKGKVDVTSSSPDLGEAKETLPVDYDGGSMQICFNAQYVLDFLSVVTTDVVSLDLKDEVSQARHEARRRRRGTTTPTSSCRCVSDRTHAGRPDRRDRETAPAAVHQQMEHTDPTKSGINRRRFRRTSRANNGHGSAADVAAYGADKIKVLEGLEPSVNGRRCASARPAPPACTIWSTKSSTTRSTRRSPASAIR